jgi:L,D-peptidoglycan transpeptidase YkuD (ErfK/YbiS/YcfS/YnhG family)
MRTVTDRLGRAPLWALLLSACLLIALASVHDPAHGTGPLTIFVIGDEKTLLFFEGEELVASMPCETGARGMGKKKEEDGKTPIGRYAIIWMASKKGDNTRPGTNPIVDGTTWCDESELYYGPTGPADERLWTDAYGGEDAVVMGLDYPNEEDRRAGRTGDCIEIHASRRLKDGKLTPSAGCVKLFCADALSLYNRVSVGTPVIIAISRKDIEAHYPFLGRDRVK